VKIAPAAELGRVVVSVVLVAPGSWLGLVHKDGAEVYRTTKTTPEEAALAALAHSKQFIPGGPK